MKKDKLLKEAQHLDNKITEIAGKKTRKLKQVRSGEVYQFHVTTPKPKVSEIKKQKWILINKQGQLSGILDHSSFQ